MTPTTLQIILWGVLALIGLSGFIVESAGEIWKIGAGLLLGAALFDGLCNLRKPKLSLQRAVRHNLPVGVWSSVSFRITSAEGRTLQLLLHDHADPLFITENQPCSVRIPSGLYAETLYRIFPTRRGHYTFPGTDIFVTSPLSLWQKKWFFACEDEVMIFPNFREIARFALMATHHHLSQMGIKKLLRRGEGQEFHQLREFRQGDEIQRIDWKATSRYRRPISREYQDERDQQIVFVLDCGRRMRHTEAKRSHLDQALNSILLLSYIATRQGDAIGLYTFGGNRKWLPPKKQGDSVRSLLLGMYDITTSTEAADFYTASQELQALQQRRALMVILTNSRSEDHDDLLHMATQLRRKHLVIIADLRESILTETLQKPVRTFQDALRFQALQNYLAERGRLRQQLSSKGIYTLDVTAEELPAALANSYLDIKRSGKL